MSEAQNQEYLLDVKNLTTYFPITEGIVITRPVAQVHAVENVTFGIRPGETLSLVGESGCGKTTTGRTIIGLEKATSGEINFEGKPVKDLSQDERRKFSQSVQMIFQDPYSSLNPRMSISDTLAEPIRVHKLMERSEIDSRIVDLLQKVNLPPEFGKRYPHEFSGGQRQRISIARALALMPRWRWSGCVQWWPDRMATPFVSSTMEMSVAWRPSTLKAAKEARPLLQDGGGP